MYCKSHFSVGFQTKVTNKSICFQINWTNCWGRIFKIRNKMAPSSLFHRNLVNYFTKCLSGCFVLVLLSHWFRNMRFIAKHSTIILYVSRLVVNWITKISEWIKKWKQKGLLCKSIYETYLCIRYWLIRKDVFVKLMEIKISWFQTAN